MSRIPLDYIDRTVAVIDGKLDVLRQREAELQVILDSIHAERTALADQRDDLESQRIPFNWLPPELLALIFELSTGTTDVHASCDRIPVALSHVSRRWRSVALSTPTLWRRLYISPDDVSEQGLLRPIMRAFFVRAGLTPHEVIYSDSSCKNDGPFPPPPLVLNDSLHTSHFFDQLNALTHLSVFGGHDVLIDALVFLRCHSRVFPVLESLTMGCRGAYTPMEVFMYFKVHIDLRDSFRSPAHSQSFPRLASLTLHDLSPACMPISHYPALRELTLEVAQDDTVRPYMNGMKVLFLARLLAFAPNVERLVLNDASPTFHARVNPAAEDKFWTRRAQWGFSTILDHPTLPPVPLARLREFAWTDAHPEALYYFFTHFPAPALEVLDVALIDIDKNYMPRHGWNPLTLALGAFIPAQHGLPPVLPLPALKTLRAEALDGDVLRLPFLKLSMPALETLSLANANALPTPQPHLPRPESIFRDPRMPHLAHLVLSAYTVAPEHAASMLGYMPALERIDCDVVAGAPELLHALAAARADRGMKCCPALRALHLWECHDVQFACLERVVKVRNGFAEAARARDAAAGPAGAPGAERPRMIKALKRSVRAATAQAVPGLVNGFDEGQPCARIAQVRIKECALISEEQARSLEQWGVEVVYS